jgi:hypothetical protein
MAKQENNPGQNSLTLFRSEFNPYDQERIPGMVKVQCPRCDRQMRWNGRLKIFICTMDGFILGPNDPYVKRVDFETPPNPEAKTEH